MSLLLDHGHATARSYPIGMVWVEADLVVERLNSLEATRAVLTQMAVASILSKKAAREFEKTIKGLTDGEN